MKKYLLSLILVFNTVFIYAAPEQPYALLLAYPDLKQKFLNNFVNGRETTYAICISPDITDQTILNKADNIFKSAFENWIAQTRFFVRFSLHTPGRNDILTMLNNEKNIKQIPCDYVDIDKNSAINPDLTIVFKKDVTEECYSNTIACYAASSDTIFFSEHISTAWYYDLLLGRQNAYNNVMTHEIGHVFGLADQYEGTSYKGSYIYNSGVKRPSIMDDSNYVTCDDVDGFISSIYRIKGKDFTFQSLCADGIEIENGKAKILKTNRVRNYTEKLKYFDTEMVISYTDKSIENNTYLIDLTVYNFDKTNKDAGIYYLHQMGFYIDDVSLLPNAKVKIHATFKERDTPTTRPDKDELYLKIDGLITSILIIDDVEVQILTKDTRLDDQKYTRKILSSGELDKLDDVMLPLINYYPATLRTIDKFDEYLKYHRNKTEEEKYLQIQEEITNNF